MKFGIRYWGFSTVSFTKFKLSSGISVAAGCVGTSRHHPGRFDGPFFNFTMLWKDFPWVYFRSILYQGSDYLMLGLGKLHDTSN